MNYPLPDILEKKITVSKPIYFVVPEYTNRQIILPALKNQTFLNVDGFGVPAGGSFYDFGAHSDSDLPETESKKLSKALLRLSMFFVLILAGLAVWYLFKKFKDRNR